MQPSSPAPKETKHEKFIRLMTVRLGRTLEEFRMLTQLASRNYEHTPEEAHEVILHLDRGVKSVASSFGVLYKTHIGSGPSRNLSKQMGAVNEIDVAKAIAHIQAGRTDAALKQLVDALNQEPR